MEQLNLPTHGRIYVDSPVIIYSVEHVEPYTTLLDPLWLHVEKDDVLLFAGIGGLGRCVANALEELGLDASDISVNPATRRLWSPLASYPEENTERFMRQRPRGFFLSRIATFDGENVAPDAHYRLTSCPLPIVSGWVYSGFRGNGDGAVREQSLR